MFDFFGRFPLYPSPSNNDLWYDHHKNQEPDILAHSLPTLSQSGGICIWMHRYPGTKERGGRTAPDYVVHRSCGCMCRECRRWRWTKGGPTCSAIGRPSKPGLWRRNTTRSKKSMFEEGDCWNADLINPRSRCVRDTGCQTEYELVRKVLRPHCSWSWRWRVRYGEEDRNGPVGRMNPSSCENSRSVRFGQKSRSFLGTRSSRTKFPRKSLDKNISKIRNENEGRDFHQDAPFKRQ